MTNTKPDQERVMELMADALSSVDDWFNALKKKQNDLLCHSLKKSCDNWDEATDVDIFDMKPIQQALAEYRKLKGGE